MNELPKYYTTLFNTAADALAALERQDFGTAKRVLIQGQLQAEGEYPACAGMEGKNPE